MSRVTPYTISAGFENGKSDVITVIVTDKEGRKCIMETPSKNITTKSFKIINPPNLPEESVKNLQLWAMSILTLVFYAPTSFTPNNETKKIERQITENPSNMCRSTNIEWIEKKSRNFWEDVDTDINWRIGRQMMCKVAGIDSESSTSKKKESHKEKKREEEVDDEEEDDEAEEVGEDYISDIASYSGAHDSLPSDVVSEHTSDNSMVSGDEPNPMDQSQSSSSSSSSASEQSQSQSSSSSSSSEQQSSEEQQQEEEEEESE